VILLALFVTVQGFRGSGFKVQRFTRLAAPKATRVQGSSSEQIKVSGFGCQQANLGIVNSGI
jgi:hypothetical protein